MRGVDVIERSDVATLLPIAQRLLGVPVERIERVRGGGNNEIFRVQTTAATFALKRYTATPDDPRDRLAHEYGALAFLASRGEPAVPLPRAVDRAAGIAVYEWIEGEPVGHLATRDIAAVTDFLARLHHARRDPAAAALPPAADACVESGALQAGMARRLRRLTECALREPQLDAFLRAEFVPASHRMEGDAAAVCSVARANQTLSPSDVGRHNMLRRPSGSLVFLDFEYFGWDDPVKLICDALWHPGSQLDAASRALLLEQSHAIYAADADFAARLAARLPLFGLRWALIVLADFIPERWERRRRAGVVEAWETVKTRQLAKARDFVERATAEFER